MALYRKSESMIVRKLDEPQVKWILAEKRKCTCNRVIADDERVCPVGAGPVGTIP